MTHSTNEIVQQFIINNFLWGNGNDLQEETSFLEKGIIDSTGILELVSFLEKTFKIHVENDEILPENLDSLISITKFVDRKLGIQSGSERKEGQSVPSMYEGNRT